MKDKPLANVRVAILATNDFEQSEMTEPRQALMEAWDAKLLETRHA